MSYIREKIEKTKLRKKKRGKKSINKNNDEKIEGRKSTIWNGGRRGWKLDRKQKHEHKQKCIHTYQRNESKACVDVNVMLCDVRDSSLLFCVVCYNALVTVKEETQTPTPIIIFIFYLSGE